MSLKSAFKKIGGGILAGAVVAIPVPLIGPPVGAILGGIAGAVAYGKEVSDKENKPKSSKYFPKK